jgi:hypothetical protein
MANMIRDTADPQDRTIELIAHAAKKTVGLVACAKILEIGMAIFGGKNQMNIDLRE